MVWAHRQGQWKGKYFSLSLSEEAAKKLCIVFSDVIFYPCVLHIVSGIENYPSPSMSYCSDDLAQLVATVLRTLKSE